MVDLILSHPDDRKPLVIGDRLKAELRREIAQLKTEMETALTDGRKRELDRQISAILELLEARYGDR